MFFEKKNMFIMAVIVVLGIIFIFKMDGKIKENTFELEKSEEFDDNIKEEEIDIQEIMVHIDGNVKNPGLFTMDKDSRLNDLVIKAGGVLEDTDTKYVNLAIKLKDEDKIYIPKIGEIQETNLQIPGDSESKININDCTKEELMNLPGIGTKKAEMIIEYRNSKKFDTIEDILEVSGVGEKTFEGFKELICVK